MKDNRGGNGSDSANPQQRGSCVLTEEEALQVIAFLTSAAEISIHEPTYYGTFRLMDAASRLMGFMLGHETPRSEAFLRELKAEVDAKKVWMMWDREAYFAFLRETPGKVAVEVKRLADEDRAGAEGRS